MTDNDILDPEIFESDPDIKAVAARAGDVVGKAEALKIETDDDYADAGSFLVDVLKPMLREVDETFGPIVKQAHATHKAAVAARKRHEQPLLDAEKAVKGAMGSYHQAKVREAERAEQERIEAARRQAEDEAVEEAARLETAGKTEAANDRLRQPVTPVVATPAPAPPKAEGVGVRTKTKYRITDESKIDRKYLQPNKSKIGQVVRAMGADAEELVGGIEVYEEPVVSARSSS